MDIRKNKLPFTIALLACFLVITLTFNANNDDDIISTSAAPNGGKVIILDAGHGGMDGGAVGVNGELEKEINLNIVKNLEKLLKISGYDVVLTRSEDTSMHSDGVEGIRNQKVSDMENRKALIDSYPESLFISIHQNRFTQPQYHGAQIFYAEQNNENKRLAQILQGAFAELQTDNDREIKIIDNELYLFKSTVQPAVLIECGFLSNPNEAAALNSPDYQKKVAFAVFKGINEYLNGVS